MSNQNTKLHRKSGGQVIVDHLIDNNIERVFSVPGESFLGAMDAFYEKGRVCRAMFNRR